MYDGGGHIAVDGSGNIYSNNTFNLSGGGSNSIIYKFSPSGTTLATATIAGDTGNQGVGIWVDAAGTVYATGKFYGTADFDPKAGTYNLTSVGQEDVYVLKLTQSGLSPAFSGPAVTVAPPAVKGDPAAPAAPDSGVKSPKPAAARAPSGDDLLARLGPADLRKRKSLLFADWLADAGTNLP